MSVYPDCLLLPAVHPAQNAPDTAFLTAFFKHWKMRKILKLCRRRSRPYSGLENQMWFVVLADSCCQRGFAGDAADPFPPRNSETPSFHPLAAALGLMQNSHPPSKEATMKFSDLFVPRWQHSNPEVRIKAINRLQDPSLLAQIVQKDPDERVRESASTRLQEVKGEQVRVRA